MPFAVSGGIKINYQVEGAESDPPLVLMHGLSDSLESWYEAGYVAGLSGYHRILLDARGHAGSDKPHDPAAYSPAAMVGDVVSVLDSCGVRAAHYFGSSMGGGIGLQMAKLAPERLLSLVVGGAYPGDLPTDVRTQLVEAMKAGPQTFVDQWEALAPISDALKGRLLLNDTEALSAFFANQEDLALDDVVTTFERPMMLIMGEQDWMFLAASALRPQFAEGAFVALPGLNHLETFQRSDLVLPILRDFFSKAVASPDQ